ncbi:MAG: arginine--tRNA ligase [Planctomycetota bacterium]|jgi:arginyl-tRNA synthetase|nr:arginine--tRNA ligase [Planctomycetota bacterium]
MNPLVQVVLDDIAQQVATRMDLEVAEVRSLLEVPRESGRGDFALPCFPFARVMRRAPQQIAEEIATAFEPGPIIQSCQATGPFVNFTLDPAERARRVLGAIHSGGDDFGSQDIGSGKTVVLDYSSPNIAKPFHVGHLRSTVIGAALIRVYRSLGYQTIGVNHLGDWGTQFGHMMAAYSREDWKDPEREASDPIPFYRELYARFNLEIERDAGLAEEGRNWFRRLEEGDQEARELWKKFHDVSMIEFDRIYRKLGVTFDHFTGESFYNDKMDRVVEEARSREVAVESEGALVISVGDHVPPVMLLKSNGTTTYHTRDLAAAMYRQETFDFEMLLYVVGEEQRLHFQQLFHALERMGFEWAARCRHVGFGRYPNISSRGQGGKRFVGLDEILDEAIRRAKEKASENSDIEDASGVAEVVGIGAVIFNDLKNNRKKDVDFDPEDWNTILEFRGDTGPYVQYSHARTASIIRKHGAPVSTRIDYQLLTTPEDRTLVSLLESYPGRLAMAGQEVEPSLVTRYLLDLTKALSHYYHKHKVLVEDPPLRAARILLIDCARQVIANGLKILGVAAPERM